jgi:hypothetical protein
MSWSEDSCEAQILEGNIDYLRYYHTLQKPITSRLIDATIRYGKETGNYDCYVYLTQLEVVPIDHLTAQLDYLSLGGMR